MDGFHGSFAAEELYAAAAFIAAEADDLDEPHHARKADGPAAGTGIALFDIDEADDAPQLIVFLTKAILSEFRVRNIMKGNGMIFQTAALAESSASLTVFSSTSLSRSMNTLSSFI